MSLYRGYFSVIGVDPFGLRYSNCSTFEVISGPLDDGSMGLNCVFSCNCPNGSKWSEEITVPWAKIYKIKGPDWAGSKSGKQICDVAAKLPFILNKGFQNCRRGNERPPKNLFLSLTQFENLLVAKYQIFRLFLFHLVSLQALFLQAQPLLHQQRQVGGLQDYQYLVSDFQSFRYFPIFCGRILIGTLVVHFLWLRRD